MKRTNIVLDDKLVEECFNATGIKTQRALIDHALRELQSIMHYVSCFDMNLKQRFSNSKVKFIGRAILTSGAGGAVHDDSCRYNCMDRFFCCTIVAPCGGIGDPY
jgi:hypothetical protein